MISRAISPIDVLPKTMRAVLLRGHGDFDQLQYCADVPVPEPAAGEVLIRIGAAGVNNTDINTRIGWYSKAVVRGTRVSGLHEESNVADSAWTQTAMTFPRIQGADACGRIVAVGTEVDPARVGERVIVDPVLRSPDGTGPAGYLGSERDGAFADFATVPAINACKVTSELSDAELASFPCSYAAAENMLTRAAVVAGERVLVTGASGGVGSAAVQLAKLRAARVVAIAAPDIAAVVKALGAG
jgi:NADPH:quinone reductase-like Zn-dependent oxidoreductase